MQNIGYGRGYLGFLGYSIGGIIKYTGGVIDTEVMVITRVREVMKSLPYRSG